MLEALYACDWRHAWGGAGILSVRRANVVRMLLLSSSAVYVNLNSAYGVMTAICLRYLHASGPAAQPLISQPPFIRHAIDSFLH